MRTCVIVTSHVRLKFSQESIANHFHLQLNRLALRIGLQIYDLFVAVRLFYICALHQVSTQLYGAPVAQRALTDYCASQDSCGIIFSIIGCASTDLTTIENSGGQRLVSRLPRFRT